MTEVVKIEAKKPIKEGFLVKKGHLRRNWRTRWFLLTEDNLEYYKNRGDSTPAGSIPLPGASLIVPRDNTAKKTFLMQLNSLCGKELLVQAPDLSTLNEWAESIEKVISEQAKKSLEAVGGAKKPAVAYASPVNHRDIIKAMQDRDAGVKLQDVTLKTTQIKKCFSGEAAVDWLVSWYFAKDRVEGISLAKEMLLEGLFQCVDGEMTQHFFSGPPRKTSATIMCKEFVDSPFVHYKFSAFNPDQSLEIFDSSDDSDQSSSDENNDLSTSAIQDVDKLPWSNGAHVTDDAANPIIKQGFLMKKRLKHVKQDWKARKFILRENSPYLYYCKGSKESKLSGTIPLQNCTITEMDDKPLDVDTTSVKKHIKRNRFSLTTSNGERVVIAAPTPEERLSWLQVLKTAIEELTIS